MVFDWLPDGIGEIPNIIGDVGDGLEDLGQGLGDLSGFLGSGFQDIGTWIVENMPGIPALSEEQILWLGIGIVAVVIVCAGVYIYIQTRPAAVASTTVSEVGGLIGNN